MILTKKILILEDNFLVLSRLFESLYQLENDFEYTFEVMVLTSSDQIDAYIHKNDDFVFDIILIDRDCKIHKSFHIFDIERIGTDRVIGISSIKRYNDDLVQRGVKRIVEKDLSDLDTFVSAVIKEMQSMLIPVHLQDFLKNSGQ